MSDLWQFEAAHVWHPYAPMPAVSPVYPVRAADGVCLALEDGRRLIDGMSSWWCAIHGYNVPELNRAVERQLADMAHVMFGGLTHRPAAELARRLLKIVPQGLEHVFFADSGSVSVEVAIKMAMQYWQAQGREDKHRLLTIRGGYHGDTFGAMSVCDPVSGMHHLFAGVVSQQLFADAPTVQRDEDWCESQMASFQSRIHTHAHELAAVILEPIVQGAGGMRVYAPEFLRQVRALCDEYEVLLIVDEIATGFGRTGKLFACEHAGISPDILCVGKALTGGYMTLAATLATEKVRAGMHADGSGVLMHGPTFMANPLACAVANASLDLLLSGPWQQRVLRIEKQLREGLAPCRQMPQVAGVRVMGAMGVVEMRESVDVARTQQALMDRGVWLRPFGKLLYTMPPFVISENELQQLTSAMVEVVSEL